MPPPPSCWKCLAWKKAARKKDEEIARLRQRIKRREETPVGKLMDDYERRYRTVCDLRCR